MRRRVFWTGLLMLTVLRIGLHIPVLDLRYAVFNFAVFVVAYRCGMWKPKVVRIQID